MPRYLLLMPNSKANKPERNPMASYARYSALAFQTGLLIAGGTYGGHLADGWLNVKFPVFMLICSLISVSGAIWLLIKELSNNSGK